MSSPDATTALPAPLLSTPLVSTQWLADHLGRDGLVVLDATVLHVKAPGGGYRWLSGLDQYLVDGHIPGAVFADVLEVFSDPAKPFGFARPDAEQIVAAAASVGIDSDSAVVLYDDSVGQWAARVWWLLRSFGFENVSVLDGGLTKWRAEERQLERGHVEPAVAAGFTAVERPEFWADKDDVAAVVAGEAEATLVCALPPTEFSGETSSRSRAGHIPGSLSLPAGRLVDRADNALLQGAALSEKLAPVLGQATDAEAPAESENTSSALAGRELAPRIITYCGGGIAAAAAALALTAAGTGNIAIYDGSLNEWTADENAPLVSLV
ncbi:thiosulfate/3-mercaptopyruvate sulfurtransferase [Microterricola gilva]|uniref:Thiosulfate/3-mercaptopyruvate sulfurtransferase n=1 Tax=Microterricola gilva TaxID=393267 RepID=A0A4Q8AN17_9MICO|nr:rhodanese-like domain-containing protein [Microterricola gilva]RZU65984.1 thiosulfate/3-mercaptopyruvate sulfurtransferase [Microterricola gilva]